MASSVVVDGVVSAEKLDELIQHGAEADDLEFKATVDRETDSARLENTKDLIALSNCPNGGYLIVGVDNNGRPAHNQPEIVESQWESANLGPAISRYTGHPIAVRSAIHDLEGRRIALIYVAPNPDHLPNPMQKEGVYSVSVGAVQREVYVFRRGEIWIRRSNANALITYADWTSVLAKLRDRIRLEARASAQDLVEQVLVEIRAMRVGETSDSHTSQLVIPLVPGLSALQQRAALVDAIDGNRNARVRDYVNTLASLAIAQDGRDELADLLNELASAAIVFAEHERSIELRLVVDALHRIYVASGNVPDDVELRGARNIGVVERWLLVVDRVIAIGGYLIRNERWAEIRTVATRQFIDNSYGHPYVYGTWLRHASVQGARADLLGNDEAESHGSSGLLSRARSLVISTPQLRPDIVTLASPESSNRSDSVLDSLAQFDLLVMLLHFASDEPGDAGVYPHIAGLRPERVLPVLHRVILDSTIRSALFADRADQRIAESIRDTLELTNVESRRYRGGRWYGVERDPVVAEYLREHGLKL